MTTKYEFRDILPEELDQVIQIEQICFPPNEACSAKNMRERVANAPETFMVAVDKETGKVAGFLNGVATDEAVFRDVLPEYRHQGLASEIMTQYVKREQKRGRECLYLTCLDNKVEMYKKMDYTDNGISGSAWGGEEWHDMSRKIR